MTVIAIKEVNRIFDCNLMETNRKQNNVDGRIALTGYLRSFSKLTIAQIATIINKDHSTVVHYCRRHESHVAHDPEYRKKYKKLKEPKVINRTICCYTIMEILTYKN